MTLRWRSCAPGVNCAVTSFVARDTPGSGASTVAFTMARSTINTLYFLAVLVGFASAARLQPSLRMGPMSEEPQSGCSPSQVMLSGVLNQLQPCLQKLPELAIDLPC